MKTPNRWIEILMVAITMNLAILPNRRAQADIFGGDVAVLAQILVQAIDQVYKLKAILGKAQETVSILQEMNRGVKEALRLAETAHVPLPAGIYDKAKKIDQAVWEAQRVYGVLADKSPRHTRTNFRSGIEALSLSQDAFEYSTYLDKQGEQVKSAAIISSQAAATRLTAETLGVLLHAVNHTNRIEAKNLEISAGNRLEDSSRENARFESYLNTHQRIEDELKQSSFSSLNGLGNPNNDKQ